MSLGFVHSTQKSIQPVGPLMGEQFKVKEKEQREVQTRLKKEEEDLKHIFKI